MTSGQRCPAELPAFAAPAAGPMGCELDSGHEDPHSAAAERSSVEWTTDDASGTISIYGVTRSSDAERRGSHADIEVSGCVFCDATEVEMAFVLMQPPGLGVAVPGRVGLCAECLPLVRAGNVEAVLVRTRSTDLADFLDDDVRALVAAARTELS